jgi:hypothetical protein
MFAYKVSEGVTDLEEGGIQEVHNFDAAELREEDFAQATPLGEIQDEDFNTVVERCQLATRVQKKGQQMADDLVISLSSAVVWIGA